MTVCVFLGPSLALEDARAALDVIYLPPARRGDIAAAIDTHGPVTIALIDGLFEQVPSVWHKEILWALDQGVAVWGASSMGAIRAAELAQFGMRGHGRIFEAYRTGTFAPFGDIFEDDDEVAVVHGPEGLDHLSTVAMVDIRATLAAAMDQGVIDQMTSEALFTAAKALFFKRRAWPAIIEAAQAAGSGLDRFADWLPDGRVHLKRQDALGLLRHLATDPDPVAPPPFNFERSLIWEIARKRARA